MYGHLMILRAITHRIEVADKKKNKGFKFPKQSQYFDNLFFVGGSVNPGGGMPMVTLSGQQVADKINAIEEAKLLKYQP